MGPIGTLRGEGSAPEGTDFGLADIDLVSQEVDVVSVPRRLRPSLALGSSFRPAAVRPLSRLSGALPVALRPGEGLAGALGDELVLGQAQHSGCDAALHGAVPGHVLLGDVHTRPVDAWR
jgi:hypothetical protein